MAVNYGDGTTWSSERGQQSPRPEGNSGNSSNGGNNPPPTPQQKQINDAESNPVVMETLRKLLMAAQILNPYAKVKLEGMKPSGTLMVSITGLDVNQANTIGLSGLLMAVEYSGVKTTLGDIETGQKLPPSTKPDNSKNSGGLDGLTSRAAEANKPKSPPTIEERAAKLYGSDKVSRKALINTYKEAKANGGVIPSYIKGDLRKKVQAMLDEDKKIVAEETAKKVKEKELLVTTAGLIVDAGGKISGIASSRYKALAKEVADNIKNFQGKNIRGYNDAMKTLNRLNSNPNMKISAVDKTALINAWKHVDRKAMATKLGTLGKAFAVGDWLVKVDKVYEKSVVGYETGNWGPLILEVESWVLSGLTAAFSLAVLSSIVSTFLIAGSLPATVTMIAGTLAIVFVASLIDDAIAEKINSQLIKSAW